MFGPYTRPDLEGTLKVSSHSGKAQEAKHRDAREGVQTWGLRRRFEASGVQGFGVRRLFGLVRSWFVVLRS